MILWTILRINRQKLNDMLSIVIEITFVNFLFLKKGTKARNDTLLDFGRNSFVFSAFTS